MKVELSDNQEKLATNIVESQRQMQFAGERLGVFQRLRELERDRKRYARKLMELDPNSNDDYSYHLR